MTQPKSTKAAVSRKGAAARAEKTKKPRKLKFDGIEFELPPSLPETVLFDIVDIEAAEERSDPMPLMRLLRSVLGPDQFTKLRNHLDGKSSKEIGEGIGEAINGIFETYGVTAGEAPASPVS